MFAIALYGTGSNATAQTLINPGFESGGAVSEIRDEFGVWQFDGADDVGPTHGIVPAQGSRMLWLERTSPACIPGCGFEATGADIAQLVDTTPSMQLIQRGHAVATFSVAVNRIVGNPQTTDTQFYVAIRAYNFAGPNGFRSGCTSSVQEVATAQQFLISDSDPTTWEQIEVSLQLPSTTRFILCAFGAVENVSNGAECGEEFDGHFVDDGRLNVSCGSCSADFNCSGAVNSEDFFDFLTCFFSPGICAPPFTADFNRDGLIISQDFFDFLAAFFAGC